MRFSIYLLLVGCLQWIGTSGAWGQQRLEYRNWQLIFHDNFNTYRNVADMAARGPWQFTPGEYRTLVNNRYEDQYYDSTGVELHKGNLHLVAQPLPEPMLYRYRAAGHDTAKLLHYRSGWIKIRKEIPANPALGDTARWPGNQGFQHGLFEIRCKQSPGAGLWPAFWLYSGPTEIDVFEGETPRRASNNVHYLPQDPAQRRVLQQVYDYTQPVDLAQGFHTYSVVWTPAEVSFYLDRKLLRTVSAAQVPTYPGPVTVIANQAVLSFADPSTWPGLPGHKRAPLIIDYIKVYKSRATMNTIRQRAPAASKAQKRVNWVGFK